MAQSTKLKPRLTHEQVLTDKMKWNDVMRYYWPDEDIINLRRLLWNETCFPFSKEKTLKQLYELYLKQEEK